MGTSPEALIAGDARVSSLPTIYTRLNEAIGQPRTPLSQIADIISEDAGLTARLLRLINSAFYGFPSRIETVSRAVMVVGAQQISDLAFATSVIRLFDGIDPGLVNMESFWKHSLACGVAARVLAAYRREANVERFFVAGVLHDIGRLVIYQKLPTEARDALARGATEAELLHAAERTVIGYDHAAVGRALLHAWKLPPSLQEVVAYHHAPREARRFPDETAIVHVADVIAHTLRLGNSGERFVPPLDGDAWDRVGLPASRLSAVADEVDRQFGESVAMIRPDPGP